MVAIADQVVAEAESMADKDVNKAAFIANEVILKIAPMADDVIVDVVSTDDEIEVAAALTARRPWWTRLSHDVAAMGPQTLAGRERKRHCPLCAPSGTQQLSTTNVTP